MPLSFRQAGNLFVAGPNIGIYPSGNSFAISGSAAGILSGTNVGTGIAVFSGAVGSNLVFRTIRAGSNAGIFLSGNDIVFSAPTGSINGVTAVTNLAGGVAVASSVTAGALLSRTISGVNGIDVFESGNVVLVTPSTNLVSNRFIYAGTNGSLLTNNFFQLNDSVGTATFGFNSPESNTTSRLLIAAGSATVSQIRLTAFSARYSSATAGDITYNSTSGNSLLFNKTTSLQTPFIFKDNNFSLTSSTGTGVKVLESDTSGNLSNNRNSITFGIFNSITSTTISGTSELSVINTGSTVLIGTNILNSSTNSLNPQLVTGKKYRFNARGSFNTDASPGNLVTRMKLGSVLIASASTALQININSNYFEIDCTFTIRSQGASGTVVGSGKMLVGAAFLISGTGPIAPIVSLGSVTINTTNDAAFDFTCQFSDNGNNIIINEATLEYLN